MFVRFDDGGSAETMRNEAGYPEYSYGPSGQGRDGGQEGVARRGLLASMKRSISGLLDLNPVSLVLVIVDTVLAHTTMLLLTDSYSFSLMAGIGIAAALFVVPQLAANLYHERRSLIEAVVPLGLLAVIVLGLFGARLLVGTGTTEVSYFAQSDAANAGGSDAKGVFVAVLMAFIMCSTAFLGFFARLRRLDEIDQERRRELINIRDAITAELRVCEKKPGYFNPETVRQDAREQGKCKRDLLRAMRDQSEERLKLYAMRRFEDDGKDGRELGQRLAQMRKEREDVSA